MSYLLTFDLGTSALKIGLFDRNGRLLQCSRQPCPQSTQPDGRIEIEPDRVVGAIAAGVGEVVARSGAAPSSIAALGLASQSNTFVLLDEDDEPLMPMISWLDTRAGREADDLLAAFGHEGLFAATGLPALVAQMALAKLLWIERRDPGLVRRSRRILLMHDYVVNWLVGAPCSDGSLWSLTGLLDVKRRRWWPAALGAVGIAAEQLPVIRSPGELCGRLTCEAAERLGLAAGTPMAVGSIDQLAGAVAAANCNAGDVSETTGTALCAMQTLADFPARRSESWVGPHAVEGRFYHLLWNERAGVWLETARAAYAPDLSYRCLDQAAMATPVGSEGWCAVAPRDAAPRVLPRLIHKQARERPGVGVAVRAVMEAVACELHRMLERLCGGRPLGVIRSLGGGARSDCWLQVKADMLGIPVERLDCEEPTSLGAAMYAAVAAGWFDSVQTTVRNWSRVGRRFEPDDARTRLYDEWRAEYARLEHVS